MVGKWTGCLRGVKGCETIFVEFTQKGCKHIRAFLDEHVPCLFDFHILPSSACFCQRPRGCSLDD